MIKKQIHRAELMGAVGIRLYPTYSLGLKVSLPRKLSLCSLGQITGLETSRLIIEVLVQTGLKKWLDHE